MVFQVPDEAGAEVAHIGLDLPDVLPEGIQLGDYDLITVGAAVPVAPADYSPCHDDDQDSDGADYLGQLTEALQVRTPAPGLTFCSFAPRSSLRSRPIWSVVALTTQPYQQPCPRLAGQPLSRSPRHRPGSLDPQP